MSNQIKNIASAVAGIIEPYVKEKGCTLWDVEYVKEGTRQVLRVTIDKEGGIDITDCEAVHRAIDTVLDETDPIPVSYYLEVSSPGIERELRTPSHYKACIGKNVDVRLFSAIDGKKQFTGTLEEFDADTGEVKVGGMTFSKEIISKISIHFDFND